MTSSFKNTPCAHLARYSIKTSSIPDDLKISQNILELSQKKFTVNSFDFELDLLNKYEANKKYDTKPERPALLAELFDSKPPVPPSQRSTSADFAMHVLQDYDGMIQQMLIRIDHKLDIDACRFLLESSEWNIDTAVDLFHSTYS